MYYLVLCGKITQKTHLGTLIERFDGYAVVKKINSDGYLDVEATFTIPPPSYILKDCIEFENIPEVKKAIKNNSIYFDKRNLPQWFYFNGKYKLIKKDYHIIDVTDGALDL